MRYDVSKDETVELVTGKATAKLDVAVLLIFFNRPEKTRAVFEQIKKARPKKLFLYQDGARDNRQGDLTRVAACRNAVKDIDWNCEVHRLYQPGNYGCDPSEFIAQKWMFSYEEMGIVLEDDDVPSLALFDFFQELLVRYKDNERIAIICGMNNYDVEKECKSSYFFSKRGSIWGWASWRRFVDLWDADYSWVNDAHQEEIIKNYCDYGTDFESYYATVCRHKASGREHYESIMFAAAAQNNMLNIVPKYNMISNIGVDAESTHSVADIRLLCSRTQKLLYKKVYEIDFPLVHPTDIEQNVAFDKKYTYRWYQRCWDRAEVLLRRILFGGCRKKK